MHKLHKPRMGSHYQQSSSQTLLLVVNQKKAFNTQELAIKTNKFGETC